MNEQLRTCTQCGGLLADEIGDICTFCGGTAPPQPPPSPRPIPLYRAPVTWTLIGLNVAWHVACLAMNHRPADFTGAYSPMVLSGAWWRLFTSMFTHHSAAHLLFNMFPLWLFGRRAERLLGSWSYLALYLTCGLASAIVSLAAYPETGSNGASGAVFGVVAIVIVAYGRRYPSLTGRQQLKFWVVIAYAVYALLPQPRELGEPGADLPGHLAGLAAGLVLGFVFTSPAAEATRVRVRAIAAALALVLIAAVVIRIHDAYVIHLENAMQAFDRHDEPTANSELSKATAMRPQSALAERIRDRIASLHPAAPDACHKFLGFAGADKHPPTLCDTLACDGDTHSIMLPPQQKISYNAVIDPPTPCISDGEIRKEYSARLHMQALDEDGDELCRSDWNGKWNEKVNTPTPGAGANTSAKPRHPADLQQPLSGAKPVAIVVCGQ